MDRTHKESFVTELRERLDRAPALFLTDFTGLDVKAMTRLRRSLKASGAEYVVVKNRLAKRVFEGTDFPDVAGALEGPTGMVFGYVDGVSAAKAVSDFARANDRKPTFKLGVLDMQILQPEQIDRIAQLPPKEQLLAELAGALEAPIAALAGVLAAKVQEMAGLLDALRQEREAAG